MIVSMKSILDKANERNYAVLAPDFFSEIDARSYIEAAEEMNAPIILGVPYAAVNDLAYLGRIIGMLAEKSSVPVAINLDHGADISQVAEAIRGGFTSVMIDCSMLPYDTNVMKVKEVVDLVSPLNISVEAEIGHVGSGESYDLSKGLTDPDEEVRFIRDTGIDACAISIGNAHGAYRGTPHIDFERLEKVKSMTRFPLVLHGSSGIGEEHIRRACRSGINKVNVCYDLLKAAYTKIRHTSLIGSQIYDFWPLISDTLREYIKNLILITGSEGKAWDVRKSGLPRGNVTMKE